MAPSVKYGSQYAKGASVRYAASFRVDHNKAIRPVRSSVTVTRTHSEVANSGMCPRAK